MHGLANLIDLSLEYIKGMFETVSTTCGYSVNHRFIMIIGLSIVQFYLNKYVPKSLNSLTDSERIFLLMFPYVLGGIPVLPYIRSLTKGDSALLTIWISLWKFISTINDKDSEEIIQRILEKTPKLLSEYSGLATNQYGL